MRVVVGVNLSLQSDEALRQGDAWARAHGWTLRACHVAPKALPFRSVPLLQDALADYVAHRIGRDAEIAVEIGTADAVLVHQPAQLLAVGSHSHDALKQLFLGDVAESVVRHAHCPVLVARSCRASGTILVASDFSDDSIIAVELAVEHARRVGANLVIASSIRHQVTTVQELTGFGAAYGFVEHEPEDARSAVERRLREELGSAPGSTMVLEGAAAPAILQAADVAEAELIVVAFGKRHLRPGVAEKVAAAAPCSVLVTRPPPTA
jgi:nucleotide-binding universal stress UspA family protein